MGLSSNTPFNPNSVMTQKGNLYVFEGPDGIGKSTLAKALTRYLKETGVDCDYLSFPGRDEGTLGHLVYQLHHDHKKHGINSIEPASLQVLHIAAHIDAIKRHILPTLEQGRTIILDRFWWSAWVYGLADAVDRMSLKLMLNLEVAEWSGVVPTAAFLITRKCPIRKETSSERWTFLQGHYADLAEKEKIRFPIFRIENEKSEADALREILGALERVEHDPVEPVQPGLDFPDFPQEKLKKKPTGPLIFKSLSPAKPTEVYDSYWYFAAERQKVYFKRLLQEPPPWTADSVLQNYKFTNAYRASDRVSQFLIKDVIYQGDQSPNELFFRIILFKIFNRIETWKRLISSMGEVSFATYSFERYDAVLTEAIERGERIFSAAYIMPSGGKHSEFSRKHRNYLMLLEKMILDSVPERLTETKRMRDAFELLASYPMLGDFLAYQYVTDLNYSPLTNFTEMEFVMPGPGARDGISKCFSDFGGLNETELIKLVTERQEQEFERLGIRFQSLWGRPLQLIDCQNLFCEISKYARVAHPRVEGVSGRTRIKQTFKPSSHYSPPWFPPKWKLNEKVQSSLGEKKRHAVV
jgi:thymidylate kinase